MVKICCDRCKKELDPNNKMDYISFNYQEFYRGESGVDSQCEYIDLCIGCMDALKKFLAGSRVKNGENATEQQNNISEQPRTTSKPQVTEVNKPTKLFRAPKDEIKKPESSKSGRKSRLDYGKIMALHNAGWSNQKIADEMGMSYNAVATAISNYKKKMRLNYKLTDSED